MADFRRLEGERVFCHQCSNEWERAHGGLTCPRCEGDFTEILEPQTAPTSGSDRHQSVSPPPAVLSPLHPLLDHNPWIDDPVSQPRNNLTTFEFTSNHGGGRISFTTRSIGTVNMGSNTRTLPPSAYRPLSPLGYTQDELSSAPMTPGSLQDLFSLILETLQPAATLWPDGAGVRQPPPALPIRHLELLTQLFNPANGRHGDMVFTQEAFDRVMTQLMEQNQAGNAPPPASEEAIMSLKKKIVDPEMLDNDGKAECSICMDNVELGDEMTILPCKHWFHGGCVTAWLKEHDTCPHCRRPISNTNERHDQSPRQRRMGRRASSLTNPQGIGPEGSRRNPVAIPESPTESRDSRQFYYGRRRDSDLQQSTDVREPRSQQELRRHGSRGESGGSSGSRGSSSGGGVTGWLRDHLPFP